MGEFLLQLAAKLRDERVGVVDDDDAFRIEERNGVELVEHLGENRFVAGDRRDRLIVIVVAERTLAQSADDEAFEERLVAMHDVERAELGLGALQKGEGFHGT